MVQVRVTDGADVYFLDLYAEEPVKLTLSIEDITDAEARSVFSRTFRVPATGNNNGFFKHAFEISGIDYDVTVKKPAQILVNGNIFREGHIRLQKIYVNGRKNTNEYEIVFLGETRDFASALGETKLSELDLSAYDHNLTYGNVTTSWQAYDGTGTSHNNGLFNGDILYPLIDFGFTADDPHRIAYTNQTSDYGFNHSQNAIDPFHFKPMIRLKPLFEKIFETAGYTFSSNFLDSNRVKHMYVSAFGNDASPVNTSAGSNNTLDVGLNNTFYISDSSTVIVEWDLVNADPGSNYSTSTYKYTVPASGAYTISARVAGGFGVDGPGTAGVETFLKHDDGTTITTLDTDATYRSAPNLEIFIYSHNLTYTGNFAANDTIYIEAEYNGVTYIADVDPNLSYFTIPSATGEVDVSSLLDNELSCIDFVKDILTTFRLVMAPDRNDPKNFIIEPWVDYIASGQTHDWSKLLDHSRDIQIEPLFFTQSDRIEFAKKEDKDYLNEFNVKQFKEVFGTLKFDSANELLKGQRNIKTENIAATPLSQINGAADSNFIIPKLHFLETEDDVTIEQPIKPITRLLFYNGLITQAKPTAWPSNESRWFMMDGSTEQPQTQFPMVSYWEYVPMQGDGLNLNWQIEAGYTNPYTGYNYTAGLSLFDQYWLTYIQSIYDKYARKITAQFVLNAYDLRDFSFDDIIFVDGNYYRPEKIVDAQLAEKELTRVELVKLLDYSPLIESEEELGGGGADPNEGGGGDPVDPVDPSPCDTASQLSVTTSVTNETTPGACDGQIQVTVSGGIAPYDVTVTGPNYNQSAVITASGGTATFTGMCSGRYTITVVDDCGQFDSSNAEVRAGGAQSNLNYTAVTCNNPGDPIVVSSNTQLLTIGDVVTTTIDGGVDCYEITGNTSAAAQATVLGTYQSCEICNAR